MMLPLSAHCRLHPCFPTNDSVHAEMPDDGGTVPEYKGEQCGGHTVYVMESLGTGVETHAYRNYLRFSEPVRGKKKKKKRCYQTPR